MIAKSRSSGGCFHLRDGTTTANKLSPPKHDLNALVADGKRVAKLRLRLSSLLWFLRYLAERIARQANAEDECTGRFWEGRQTEQSLRALWA